MAQEKHNIVIITEDSKSGKDLYRYINTELYHSQYHIEGTGGNLYFRQTVARLVKDGWIHKGTVVFLAVDNIALLNGFIPHSAGARIRALQLMTQLTDAMSFITEKIGGVCIQSTYMCIEEAVLSFKYLTRMTHSAVARRHNVYENDLINWYNTLGSQDRNMITGKTQPNALFYIYRLYPLAQKYGKSCEELLSGLLNALTKSNPHTDFEITKTRIGDCLHMSCSAAVSRKNVRCDECALHTDRLFHGMILGSEKLRMLVRNSRLSDVFKAIWDEKKYLDTYVL